MVTFYVLAVQARLRTVNGPVLHNRCFIKQFHPTTEGQDFHMVVVVPLVFASLSR
jgi:hypothetical protein